MSCRNSQEGEISIRFSAISKIAIGGWRRRYGGREAPAPIGEEAQPAAIALEDPVDIDAEPPHA
jgi:hypothetical protein